MSMDPNSYIACSGVDLPLFKVGGARFGDRVGAPARGDPGKEVGLDGGLGSAPIILLCLAGETLAGEGRGD